MTKVICCGLFVTAFLLASVAYAGAPTANLQAWYKADAGVDVVGSAGQAFADTDLLHTSGNVTALDGTGNLTAIIAFATDNVTERQGLVNVWHFGTPHKASWALMVKGSDDLRAFVANSAGDGGSTRGETNNSKPGGSIVTAGEFMIWSTVYDGSGATTADRLKFYKDGAQLDPINLVGEHPIPTPELMDIDEALVVGTWTGIKPTAQSFNKPFDGDMAEILLYDSSDAAIRSQAELYLGAKYGISVVPEPSGLLVLAGLAFGVMRRRAIR